MKELYMRDRPRELANRKKWYQDNRERVKAENKNHYHFFREEVKFSRIFYKFGMTKEVYLKLLEEQNHLCAICQKSSNDTLAVDHNHITGQYRGLLCGKCNMALGLLDEDINRMNNLRSYVLKYQK